MADNNTDNLSMLEDNSIDSPDNGAPKAADDFFEALDRKVNEGILEQEDEPADMQSERVEETSEMSPETNSQEHNWEKRYSDSSDEARRLNGRLGELEPYVPVLDAMRKDPNLVSHVRNYFEGGGQTPQNMAERLELPEDFEFDSDDAFKDPESNSAKVLGATIDGVVQRRLNGALKGQRAENSKLAKETAFRQKHNLSDEQWEDFVEFAKSKSLELEDIYTLKNMGSRDEKIADDTRRQMQDKMRDVQQQPGSLATTGGAQVESSPDDAIFNSILGTDQKLDNIFG